jgi:hypothetical protein
MILAIEPRKVRKIIPKSWKKYFDNLYKLNEEIGTLNNLNIYAVKAYINILGDKIKNGQVIEMMTMTANNRELFH